MNKGIGHGRYLIRLLISTAAMALVWGLGWVVLYEWILTQGIAALWANVLTMFLISFALGCIVLLGIARPFLSPPNPKRIKAKGGRDSGPMIIIAGLILGIVITVIIFMA